MNSPSEIIKLIIWQLQLPNSKNLKKEYTNEM